MKNTALLISCLFIFFKSYSQKQVVFIVKFDGENHRKVVHASYDYIANKYYLCDSKTIKINSKKEKIIIELLKPAEINIFNHTFFVEPGQIFFINYYLKNDSISFRSKFSGNGSYNDLIENREYEKIDFDKISGNELLLAQQLKKNCFIKLSIIDSLYSKNIMTINCHKYIHNEIYYSYLSSLIFISRKTNFNNTELRKSILKDVEISKFQDSSNLDSKFYGFALSDFCLYVLNKQNSILYTGESLENLINIIKINFKGQQKEFLLSYIFRIYCRKQIPEYKILINSTYTYLNFYIKSPIYLNVISTWFEYYSKANKEMPDYVMNAFVYNIKGDSVKFTSLFKKDSKNIIDFWASWCSPCITQIKEYSVKKVLAEDKMNFIFISIDNDISKYVTMSNKLNLISYRLSPFNSEKIQNYFSIPPIPSSILIEANQIKDFKFDLHTFLTLL